MLSWWRRRREQAAIARRPIADDLWKRTLVRYPFLRRGRRDGAPDLRRLCSLFLDRKEFTAVPPLRLTNDVVVAIAAQACLPVLELGLDRYDGFVGIVVHADQVVARREVVDDDGIAHEYDEVLSGEAQHGGPVMLSWHDVRSAGRSAAEGYNVVIHEFAHMLDMADGAADGVPLLPREIARADWLRVLLASHAEHARAVDAGAEPAIDPYAAEAPEEFFAVTSEAFFVAPLLLREAYPQWYALLARFYRQDPALVGGDPPSPPAA